VTVPTGDFWVIGEKRVVAIVTARAGSRSIPNKNLVEVGGKSIVRRAVETAIKTPEVDRVFVSTDGDLIAEEAKRYGAEIIVRPESLAGDLAIVKDVLLDVREQLRAMGETAEIMVLLEPTSPLRQTTDVSECIRRLEEENFDSLATFCEAAANPYRVWRIEDGRPYTFIAGAIPWQPRQTLPPAYQLNGAVYCFRSDGLVDHDGPSLLFGRTGAVIMPNERSVDIDTIVDLDIANAAFNRIDHKD
jgi:CMP-N,N'-diacetyllegionaminic acid synthase